MRAPGGTVFPDCFGGLESCYPSYVIDGQAVAGAQGSESGNGSMVTLAVPKPIAAGQVVSVSIAGVTNAPATGLHSLALWTSSNPVPVRAAFALSARRAVTDAAINLSSTVAGASGVVYTVRFRTGAHGALPSGFGRLQGGVGAVPAETVTLVGPAGTVFPGCFSFEQTCYPTYLINGNKVVPGGGSLGAEGAMVTLALPKAVAAGQLVTISIDEMANGTAPGRRALTVWTSSDPVPVRIPLTLTAPGAVQAAALSLSSTEAGAAGVAYHVDFTTGPRGALAVGYGAGQGGFDSLPTETVFLAAPAGTAFAQCVTLACPDYPAYLVNGKAAPWAVLAAAGRVVGVALPEAVASSARVALDVGGVTNSASPGAHVLLLWTSSDPRPVVLHYSLAPPVAVSHPLLRLSDRAPGRRPPTR